MLPKSAFADEAEYLSYLRDWFAGQALAGVDTQGWTAQGAASELAQRMYAIADALLAHREKLAVGMIDQMKGERK